MTKNTLNITPDIIHICKNHLFPQSNLTQNPTKLTNPYWQWVVRHRLNPYQILEHLPHLDSHLGKHRNADNPLPPLWSFERIGQSKTALPDGRTILIGGEFDDFYDPNFCIFNDVVVESPNGDIEIYGYPISMFAPTDFHSATLIGDEIYIIGNVGEMDTRQYHATPMYKLNIHSLAIEKIETRNHIGLISHHTAILKDNQIIITGGQILDENMIFDNIDEWAFNPKTLTFKNLTNHHWQGFMIERKDFGWLSLFDYHCLAFDRVYYPNEFKNKYHELKDKLGIAPNLELYEQLFIPPITHHQDKNDENVIWIDDIKVRFVDDMNSVQVYIEGQLSDNVFELLKDNLVYKLSKLENYPCEVKHLPFHTPFGVHKKAKKVKKV